MKKILSLILLIFLTTILFSQSNYQDVVYLKNGSIIRGIIIEQVPNKSIKIETADRNIFFYEIDEIEKLTKEPNLDKGNKFLNKASTHTGLKSGYKGIAELDYLFGVGYYGIGRLEVNIINGYQFNPYFSLGLGTGFRWYSISGYNAVLIPIFADFRVNFMDNKISPYFSLGLGYSLEATDGFNGVGVLLKPSIGVNFKVTEKIFMHTGIGYEMQKMKYYDYYYNSIGILNSGGFGFNFGVSF
jgi:hypothetical protein